MLLRACVAVVLGCLVIAPASAQTVRFDTNVGTFDLDLNPTGNPNLQGHVDNIVDYVNAGSYDLTVINRAAEGFVMQMGGFLVGDSLSLPSSFSAFPAVEANAPVIVDADNDGNVDFDVSALLNTRGTVSLALSNNANTGTSSFFINIGDNPSLDAANLRFVPFATVNDMATIDLIMGLPQANLSDGGLAGDDVPLLPGNRLVFVERAFVIEDEVLAAASSGLIDDVLDGLDDGEGAGGAGSGGAGGGGAGDGGGLGDTTPEVTPLETSVPEPSSLLLALGALLAISAMKPSRIR